MTPEPTPKPSLDLLRSLTDEHVLRALMRCRQLTRAELASQTGISKPPVGESVRRLAEAGLVVDTGERTPGGRGRGRVGTYYALGPRSGDALAVSVQPGGVVAECVNVFGDTVSRAEAGMDRPGAPGQAVAALQSAVAGVTGDCATVRAAVVSAAGPVDRASGRLVRLPDEPFRLGKLDAAAALRSSVSGPVIVDNDVNWAARAERDGLGLGPQDDFVYLFLGEGLGAAMVSNGEVVRGHAGLAGEVAHVVVPGARGQVTEFIDVFGALGLRHPGSTAIDVPRLLVAAADPGGGAAIRDAIARAVSGVLAACTALADPRFVVIGGAWGSHPAMLAAIAAAAGRLPRPVAVQPAAVTAEPSLAGARDEALALLRAAILATAWQAAGRPA